MSPFAHIALLLTLFVAAFLTGGFLSWLIALAAYVLGVSGGTRMALIYAGRQLDASLDVEERRT